MPQALLAYQRHGLCQTVYKGYVSPAIIGHFFADRGFHAGYTAGTPSYQHRVTSRNERSYL